MYQGKHTVTTSVAVLLTAALVVCSCKGKIQTTGGFDINEYPFQVVDSMFIIQTDKGLTQMRAKAPRMERYKNDSLEYDLFPAGFYAFSYDEQGRLETEITADHARHSLPRNGVEEWVASGNVVVKNLINKETMETDTLYWDKDNERIYTDCYVRLTSPDGFMQGYGMESDQRARSSVIRKPFNSYGIMGKDSTAVIIDSINFVGPFPVEK